MNFIKSNKVALVALIVALIALFTPVTKTNVLPPLGSATITPTNYTNLVLSNQLVTGGAAIRTDGLASSTSNVLGLADLQGNSMIYETSATGTAYTVTFPATSTLSGWMPHQGDYTDIVFLNASTTGPTISFASSTGVVFHANGTTTPNFQVVAGGAANLRVIRTTNNGNFFVQIGVTL
jgi:hypothetical protein